MYCVKCGVELADSQRVCPLCGTRVFHPDIPRTPADPPYPPDERVHPEEVNRSGVCFILTALALLPAVICVLCDWRINGGILWSGYASGGILLLYVLTVLPLWFKRPNPVIFVPVDFAAIILYLLYIDLCHRRTLVPDLRLPRGRIHRGAHHHRGGAAALRPPGVSLHLRRRLIAAGGLAMLLEFLLNLTSASTRPSSGPSIRWPPGVLLGVMLIIIAVCPPLRRSLHRKFFL